MPLYDFQCTTCSHVYEKLVDRSDSLPENCPKCSSKDVKKLISKFRIGGQGDLRETYPLHGCHPAIGDHDHGDHSDDH